MYYYSKFFAINNENIKFSNILARYRREVVDCLSNEQIFNTWDRHLLSEVTSQHTRMVNKKSWQKLTHTETHKLCLGKSEEVFQEHLKESVVLPIYKKSSTTEHTEFPGISPSPITNKIVYNILLSRLTQRADVDDYRRSTAWISMRYRSAADRYGSRCDIDQLLIDTDLDAILISCWSIWISMQYRSADDRYSAFVVDGTGEKQTTIRQYINSSQNTRKPNILAGEKYWATFSLYFVSYKHKTGWTHYKPFKKNLQWRLYW
jgi:hypothetical protein